MTRGHWMAERRSLSLNLGPKWNIATQITPAQLQVLPQSKPCIHHRRPPLESAPSCGRPGRAARQVDGLQVHSGNTKGSSKIFLSWLHTDEAIPIHQVFR